MSILGVQGVKRLKTNLCLGDNQFYVAMVIFILRFRHCLGNLHKQIKLRLINYSFANVTTVGVSQFSPWIILWSYLKKGTLLTQRWKLVTDCWRTSVGARSDFSHIPTYYLKHFNVDVNISVRWEIALILCQRETLDGTNWVPIHISTAAVTSASLLLGPPQRVWCNQTLSCFPIRNAYKYKALSVPCNMKHLKCY